VRQAHHLQHRIGSGQVHDVIGGSSRRDHRSLSYRLISGGCEVEVALDRRGRLSRAEAREAFVLQGATCAWAASGVETRLRRVIGNLTVAVKSDP
jgi:hypothetical protein